MINRRIFAIKLFVVLVFAFSIYTISAIAKDMFLLPGSGQIGTWEAEKAQMLGEWKLIQDPSASAGKNVVVIEPSNWIRRWGENLRHPRAEEYAIINRFSDPSFRYIIRDKRMVGYSPEQNLK